MLSQLSYLPCGQPETRRYSAQRSCTPAAPAHAKAFLAAQLQLCGVLHYTHIRDHAFYSTKLLLHTVDWRTAVCGNHVLKGTPESETCSFPAASPQRPCSVPAASFSFPAALTRAQDSLAILLHPESYLASPGAAVGHQPESLAPIPDDTVMAAPLPLAAAAPEAAAAAAPAWKFIVATA